MNDHALWNLIHETWAALGPHFMPLFEHLSAESGLDGQTWGLLFAALTFEPEATTAARLQVRGPYTDAGALAQLRKRGFVAGPDSAPRVTDAGRAFRDEVEADTDRYFFAPWGFLDDAERAEMADLLTRLRDGLRRTAP